MLLDERTRISQTNSNAQLNKLDHRVLPIPFCLLVSVELERIRTPALTGPAGVWLSASSAESRDLGELRGKAPAVALAQGQHERLALLRMHVRDPDLESTFAEGAGGQRCNPV